MATRVEVAGRAGRPMPRPVPQACLAGLHSPGIILTKRELATDITGDTVVVVDDALHAVAIVILVIKDPPEVVLVLDSDNEDVTGADTQLLPQECVVGRHSHPEDQALRFGRVKALVGQHELVLDQVLQLQDVRSRQGADVEREGGAVEVDEEPHAATKSQHQEECVTALDVVVRQGTAVLQLLACKDQALVVGWNTCLGLDLGLHVVDRLRRVCLDRDGLAGQSPYKALHATVERGRKNPAPNGRGHTPRPLHSSESPLQNGESALETIESV